MNESCHTYEWYTTYLTMSSAHSFTHTPEISRVQGLGFRVQGLGCRVQGLGFRVVFVLIPDYFAYTSQILLHTYLTDLRLSDSFTHISQTILRIFLRYLRLSDYQTIRLFSTRTSEYAILLRTYLRYGVATISRLLKMIGLFCRISSLLQGSFAKETYHRKEPTNRSHPIPQLSHVCARIPLGGFFGTHTLNCLARIP